MNDKSAYEQLIKSEYERNEVPFNESLWNQLDQQLAPYRHIEEKRKRRAIAWWSVAAITLMGGSYLLVNQKNLKPDSAFASKKPTLETSQQSSSTNTINSNQPTVVQEPLQTQSSTTIENTQGSNTNGLKGTINPNGVIKNESRKIFLGIQDVNIDLTKKLPSKSGINKNTTNDLLVERNITSNEKINEVEKTAVTTDEISKEEKAIVKVDVPAKENKEVKDPKIISDIAVITDAQKIASKTPLEIYVNSGLNMASPFNKTGYFGGIQIVKPIDDKRIFAGIKLSNNNLNHQFIASKNTATTPNTTDAVINKMTVIQLPFGYQFLLSKSKNKKPLQLNVGFEPSFITGLQTIFYDDNGIIGGPRTPVMNSPLLKNAINKFNVSFIAGIQKQITNKIGISVNAGYNMIDLTDKQYYNRTSNNNNLKYLQLGLLYRLK